MWFTPLYSDGLYLAHHGVKGQKWGVRRYQNLDGSLTPLGRIHYGVGKRLSKYSKLEKQDIKMTAKINNVKLYRHDAISCVNASHSDSYDKSTGLLRKEGTSSVEEDMLKINPQLGYGKGFMYKEMYSTNCGLCSVAYAMRRKGYDVCAKPMTSGEGVRVKDVVSWFEDADKHYVTPVCNNGFGDQDVWELPEKDSAKVCQRSIDHLFRNERDFKNKCNEQGRRIISECESYGPNAYGLIGFRIAQSTSHAIAFENDENGKTRLIDTQIANTKYYNPKNRNQVWNEELQYADPYIGADIVRLDNATPNYDKIKKYAISNPTLVNIERKNGDKIELKMYQDRSKDVGY